MEPFFDTEHCGKRNIASSYSRCVKCNRLTIVNSYSTTQFIHLLGVPVIPVRKLRILDECPVCGFRGTTTRRRYTRERKRNLALMMDGFAEDADNPDNCCHALQTLTVYDEKSWFDSVQKEYGRRFSTYPHVQHLIAQGHCRFGEFEEAIESCHKAIALGAGTKSEELLQFCLAALVAIKHAIEPDELIVKEESTAKAYIPLISIASGLAMLLTGQGISAMQTHRAWLVNGSLQTYQFELDEKEYTLEPGSQKNIKLKTGRHQLSMNGDSPVEFDYSIPRFKQLLSKHLLVVNPDSMALLAIETEKGKLYSHSQIVHPIPGVAHPRFVFHTLEDDSETARKIALYRPETHMKQIQRFRALELGTAARDYARRALKMNPASPEAEHLLEAALDRTAPDDALTFLKQGTASHPVLMPWHLHYQNLMLIQGKRRELIREYSEHCSTFRDEPEWCYLLGLVVEKQEDAIKFFQYSEKGRGMNGAGYQSIAALHYCSGEFAQALPWTVKALEKDPENPAYRHLYQQTLLALRKYDQLLAGIDQSAPENMEQTVLYLTCAGYHVEAEAAVARFGNEVLSDTARLNAIRFHAVGNMDDYLQCTADNSDPHAELKRFYHLDRIAEADALLSANKNHVWWEHLMIYCAAMHNRETDVAEAHLKKGVAEINWNQPDGRIAVQMLTSSTAPDLQEIKRLKLTAKEKALLCSSLAIQHPDHRSELLELSNRYNFEPTYPWLFLKHWNSRIQQTKPATGKALKPAA